MKARAIDRVEGTGDVPNVALPRELLGAVIAGVAEVLTDDGRHQAYAIVLRARPGTAWVVDGHAHALVALWWRREPSREWAITPLT